MPTLERLIFKVCNLAVRVAFLQAMMPFTLPEQVEFSFLLMSGRCRSQVVTGWRKVKSSQMASDRTPTGGRDTAGRNASGWTAPLRYEYLYVSTCAAENPLRTKSGIVVYGVASYS